VINSLIKVSKKYTNLSSFQQALIHKSISRIKNNERLEFLGDAVLEIVISEYLFNNFSKSDEGVLTQMRASLVNTQSLSEIFLKLDCSHQIQVSKGTNNLDETHKHSIYAGTLEACVGAIFIEIGSEEAKSFVLHIFAQKLSELSEASEFKDAKSRLQEYLQAMNKELPEYKVNSNEEGTHFYCDVIVLKKVFSASSEIKKDAEQKAAELALKNLNQL
jgi:ribonuclease-3|tara:strand:+ start:367 stop:1020 length:654 start_codon:yes stop_codon:yes gene_type:complete